MRERLEKLFPFYAIIPIAACLIFNVLVYNGNRLLTADRVHFDLSIPFIDGNIPFWRWMIVFYVLSYVYWAAGFLVVARENRAFCYEMCAGEMIGKFFCLVFFLAMPTVMPDWPSGTFEINNGIDWLTQFIYDMDEPNNLFPSIHCSESWFCLRAIFGSKKTNVPFRIVAVVMTVGIFASTVLVKQHVFVDIIGGVAVAEAGLLLGRKLRAGRLFERLEPKALRVSENV